MEEVNKRQSTTLASVEATVSQQNFQMRNFAATMAQHNVKMTSVEATVAQQKAKLLAAEMAISQQNAKLATSDVTTRQQLAKLATVEAVVTQQTAQLAAATQTIREQKTALTEADAVIRKQAAQLTTAVTALTAVEATASLHGARLATVETAIQPLTTAMDALASRPRLRRDVCADVKSACSQICVQVNGRFYVGSGWFYYDALDDLRHGYFVTAAHCVMQVVEDRALLTMECGFIQDPTTDTWVRVDVRSVFYDGVADVALIKTDIDLSNHPRCALKLAVGEPVAGDTCYVVGNPGGLDEDSVSVGCVRDPHYCEPGGYQITDSIFVTCPGMGGNSGGPIVDEAGGVVGIYTFGVGESFGGGSNKGTLQQTLSVLKARRNNRQKRYLGLDWLVPSPFLFARYYPADARFSTCVYINRVGPESPFASVLSPGDLLLSATLPSGEVVEFGNTNNQRTPGVLVYYYEPIAIQIAYVKPNQQRLVATVVLNRTYDDVSLFLDGPLQTGLLGRRSKLLDRLTSLAEVTTTHAFACNPGMSLTPMGV